jgi:elongation factor Ts
MSKNITMELIKELREKTLVGMMDCKKALIESDGDIEKAIEILRKKGSLVASKRASNETNHGQIESCISKDYKTGVILKVSCETDFSANTQDLKDFAKETCEQVLQTNPSSITDGDNCLMNQKLISNSKVTINDRLNDLIAKIAENIKVETFVRYHITGNGIVGNYIHSGSNLGILIELSTDKAVGPEKLEELKALSKDICMQIAVTNPIAISSTQIDTAVLEKERAFHREQLATSGKPANIIDKILEGKMNKYYEDVCLLNQKFIKNDKVTIQEQINQTAKNTGLKIEVKHFTRLSVGK